MNTQIRRLTVVVIVMFLSLMVSTTSVQFFQAGDLNADGRNVRNIYREYGRDRGSIIVAGEAVASSTPVDDVYGYQRQYPGGELYAPVTGFFSVGLSAMQGLERSANEVLNGTSDDLLIQRIQDLITGSQPQGGSIELTLDPQAQQVAWDALGDQRGSVVALDSATGEILAMVSKPSYDPNPLASHDPATARAALEAYESDPDEPMQNRAIGGDQYAPGSAFKVITAAAFLEADAARDPGTMVEAPTQLTLPQSTQVVENPGELPCGDGSGQVTLTQALRQSCNTPFALLAMQLGEQRMADMAEAFGFGQPLSIPLGVTPSRYPTELSDAELAMTGFGQHSVRVTPLQMAMVAATVANDGVQMQPYLVRSTLGPDLEVVAETQPSELRRPVSAETADELERMLFEVVDNGTGTEAQIPGLEVYGKTGSAQSGDEAIPPHAWFIGYTSTDARDVAVAVVVEEGGDDGFAASGGTTAAPIARAVLQAVVGR